MASGLWGRSLLPPNATPVERAISEAIAEAFGRLPSGASIADAVRPSATPVPLLPFLAWEWSVDEWNPTWSIARQRIVVGASWSVHSIKGTREAIEIAIDALGYGALVSEWYEHGGAPFTFRLTLNSVLGAEWTSNEFRSLYRAAIRAKNVRSFLDRISLRVSGPSVPVFYGAATRSRIRIRPSTQPMTRLVGAPPIFIASATRTRVRVKPRTI